MSRRRHNGRRRRRKAQLTGMLRQALEWRLRLALACEALGVTMDEAAEANVEKLRKRYPDSYSHVDSINRRDVTPPGGER